MIGNEEDFTAALGFEVEGVDEHLSELDPANFSTMIDEVVAGYPELQGGRHHAAQREDGHAQRLGRHLLDRRRVLRGAAAREPRNLRPRRRRRLVRLGLDLRFPGRQGPQWAVEYGAAHGALAMTTPGDTTMATLTEVERVMKGGRRAWRDSPIPRLRNAERGLRNQVGTASSAAFSSELLPPSTLRVPT